MPTITFATLTQAMLFELEIKGQLSDGHWENARPINHWRPWCQATVNVGPSVGRDFYVDKDNYGLTSSELLDVVGDRMIAYARYARAVTHPTLLAPTLAEQLKRAGNARCVIPDFMRRSEGHVGDAYWDKKREEWDALEASGVFALMRIDTYGMKELKADLRAMKEAMKMDRHPFLGNT